MICALVMGVRTCALRLYDGVREPGGTERVFVELDEGVAARDGGVGHAVVRGIRDVPPGRITPDIGVGDERDIDDFDDGTIAGRCEDAAVDKDEPLALPGRQMTFEGVPVAWADAPETRPVQITYSNRLRAPMR